MGRNRDLKIEKIIIDNYILKSNKEISKEFGIPLTQIRSIKERLNLWQYCKCGCFKKTYNSYHVGHTPTTKERNNKISNSMKGRIPKNFDILQTKECIEKSRLKRIGHLVSKETRNKISLANSGEKNGMFRENSFMNICRKIRKRDNYVCLLCGLHQEKNNNKSLDVHHIDYNHSNNIFQNMISLCHSCHAKTNKSKRDFWIKHFHSILSEKYGYKYLENGDVLIDIEGGINNEYIKK